MDFVNLNYFSFDIKEIELWLSILTFVIGTFFGAMIILGNPKSWTNRLFAILVLAFDAYIVCNYLSLHPLRATAQNQLFWIRMVMFSASFIGPTLLLFVDTFPGPRIKIKTTYLVTVILIGAASAVASILPFVFKSLEYTNGTPLPIPGPGMPIFFLNFGLIIISFFILISKYRKSIGVEKTHQLYLLSGVVWSFTLIGICSLVFVVILKSATLVFLGPIFFLILIGSIAYAIVKYQLFSIKVIATQILVATIWIVLFSKIFVARSWVEGIIDLIAFILVLIFGIFLIKSVKKEVKQREALEKLTKELESANDKLKELDKLKSEFLSFASHQVKAPMAAVKGFASLIYDGTYGAVPDKVKESAKKIVDSADRLVALVNNLLDLRKIEEGKMEIKLEKINISKLVSEVIEDMKPLADKKNLSLSLDLADHDSWANADPQKFRQVIQNLVENSIKYTEFGWVKVHISTDSRFITILVSDSGHGISRELLPMLFEEFKRESSIAKQIEGTGLGLYIAKNIITAHKGEIWAESEGEGEGSKFFVRIPALDQSV